jgi:hypothetical protein
LFAYLLFYKRKPIPIILGLLLIALAITIHRSAYIFYLIPLVMLYSLKFKKFNAVVLIVILALSVFGRVFIWNMVNSLFKEVDSGTAITLGGNFLFMIVVMVFCVFTYESYYGIGFFGSKRRALPVELPEIAIEDTMCLRVSELCIIGQIVFSGDSMLRTVNYFIVLMIPLLPRMLSKYRKDQRIVLQIGLTFFLLYLFIDSLISNQLNIAHYQFFWETV